MNETSLLKIKAGTQNFFLLVKFKGDELTFDITVTDTINVWIGQIDDDKLQELSSDVGQELQKYVEETKKALMVTNGKCDAEFEYQVKNTRDGEMKLSWKQVMADDKIKFQLGSVTLVPSEDPSVHVHKILEHSIQNTGELQRKIKSLETENDRLSEERRVALLKYEKCVKQKEDMETGLYAKFCSVLNEKKAKIRQLKASGPVLNEDIPGPSGVKQEDDDEDDEKMEEDEVSTDEERETSRKKPKKARKVEVAKDDQSDSLILTEEPMDTTRNRGKRRKRQAAPKVDSTPSKPSIPRISSAKGSKSTPATPANLSSKQSIQKTPSTGRRGRSTDQDDADDLFDEM